MRIKFFLIPLLLLFVTSCGTKLKTVIATERPPLAYDEEVYVAPIDKSIPKTAKFVGEASIGDNGFTIKCNYELVIDQAKLKARENGANLVKILKHKKPDLWSTCHRIKVAFYFIADTSDIQKYTTAR